VRMVNINSNQYHIAREFMIRLEKSESSTQLDLKKMALALHTDPEKFVKRFGYLLD